MTPCHYLSGSVNYFLRMPVVSQNDECFIKNNTGMSNKIDIDAVREIANHLAGSLDLLANLHAALAVHDGESKPLASTFALLHANAVRLERLLNTT